MNLQKLKDWFEADENQDIIANFFDNLNKEDKKKSEQLERFSRYENFADFIEKVIEKSDCRDIYT